MYMYKCNLPPSLFLSFSLYSSSSPTLPLFPSPSLSLSLRVILCKGLVYPPVHPRPVMTTIPLTIPLCEPNTEKTNIEVKPHSTS